MSCGCNTSGDSTHNCGTKALNGCGNVDNCGNSYKLSVFDWLSNIHNPTAKKCDLVEVRFKNDRKYFYKNINNLPLHIGSVVTVESNPGHDVGVVSLTGELVKIQIEKKRFPEEGILKIYRHANQKDVELWQEMRNKEDDVKIEARKIARNLNLDMKITDVEFQGDGGKVTFYYTAENRVDFRQLIKEYATTFRTKIDMKQIGFRQEAAKVGGIGSCGRELCCSTWLTDFRSVNTNAARYQQLSINPQKLAGQCGKLKCCLNYELDSYMDALNNFPSSNTTLDTEKGKAFCIKIDVFKRKMWFAYVENPVAWYDLDISEVKKIIASNKKGEKGKPLEELKTMAPENSIKNADLIQENSVDRFEKKLKDKGRSNKKDFKKRTDSGQTQAQHQNSNQQKPQRDNKSVKSPDNQLQNNASQENNEQKTGQKRNPKKFPKKRDNNI